MKYKRPDKRFRRLIDISDKLENRLEQAVDETSDPKNYKDLTAAIKDAISIRRDLLGIPGESKGGRDKSDGKKESAVLRVEITPPEYAE